MVIFIDVERPWRKFIHHVLLKIHIYKKTGTAGYFLNMLKIHLFQTKCQPHS